MKISLITINADDLDKAIEDIEGPTVNQAGFSH